MQQLKGWCKMNTTQQELLKYYLITAQIKDLDAMKRKLEKETSSIKASILSDMAGLSTLEAESFIINLEVREEERMVSKEEALDLFPLSKLHEMKLLKSGQKNYLKVLKKESA